MSDRRTTTTKTVETTAGSDAPAPAGQAGERPPAPLAAEIAAGQGLSFAQAAREEPPFRGKRAWPSTFWRRVSAGVRAWDGTVVRLEAMRVGRRWLTSRAALARFYQRLTPTFETRPTPALEQTGTGGPKANSKLSDLGYWRNAPGPAPPATGPKPSSPNSSLHQHNRPGHPLTERPSRPEN